jgi:prepilin-type N-terminal cleavage/methylation domain-containing protein
MIRPRSESGFSLIELLVATGVLLIISSIVTSALLQMTRSQMTIWNRTEMHSGIRGATELLQQEVGQAGRVTLPATVTLGAAVTGVATCNPDTPTSPSVTVAVSSVAGMFAAAGPPSAYMMLTTLDGDNTESFRVGAVLTGTPSITACFSKDHAAGTVIMPMGGFATGIVPPTGIANGSSGTKLKMYGDINGDGNMVFVQYTCDTTVKKLYRQVMAFDATSKPAPTDNEILLDNVVDNPGGTPCFTYQTATRIAQGTTFTFVLDVAITFTVETEQLDPLTNDHQRETKALLNVSPRNVFAAWSLANIGYTDRIQSTPVTVNSLLADPS